jgi:ubiquinone/menaquinone biosynthesis C-methylase UbiE
VDIFEQVLGDMAGGRVLDIATGRGGFINTLKRCLGSYTEIVGIDSYERAIRDARFSFVEADIHFLQMDAENLAFRDQSFETVALAKSLHHLANIRPVLAEIVRALKPGGHLILCDMHRDAQTEPQRTDVYIHHWAAEVDTALGFCHNRTFTRQEIADLVENLGLRNIAHYDSANTDSDPRDPEAIGEKLEIIDRCLRRARETSDYHLFEQRGQALRQRLRDVGIQSEPVLLVVAQKA